LVEEVPFPGRLEAAVKEMGGVGEAGCGAIWRKIRRRVGRIAHREGGSVEEDERNVVEILSQQRQPEPPA
jgi:hypothetical protein